MALQSDSKEDSSMAVALDANSQPVTASNIVNLNVGGAKFATTKSTLQKSGYFKALLSGKFGDKLQDGSYFIDKNGEYFKYLLEYMRSGYVAIPSAYASILQLEARFYQINLNLKEIIQRINAPDLRVVYDDIWNGTKYKGRLKITHDRVSINGKPLKSV